MHGDARSRRVVVVPDSLLNPPPNSSDQLTMLAAEGFGVMALPPAETPPSVRAELRASIVDQIVTFLDDGYLVVCLRPDDDEVRLLQDALVGAGRSELRTLTVSD